MGTPIFNPRSLDTHLQTVVELLPGGRPFLAAQIPGTTFRKMLLGLVSIIKDHEDTLLQITEEHYITDTTLLIDQWERALGLPDRCLSVSGKTLFERRNQVLFKLAASIQTAEDFVYVCSFVGIDIRIRPCASYGIFALPFGVTCFDRPQTARFTAHVTVLVDSFPNLFPLDFPISFGSSTVDKIICFLRRIIPANSLLLFNYELNDQSSFILENGSKYLVTEDGYYLTPE